MYDCYTEVTAFLTSAFEEVQVHCKAVNKIHQEKERENRKNDGKGGIDERFPQDLERVTRDHFKRQNEKKERDDRKKKAKVDRDQQHEKKRGRK